MTFWLHFHLADCKQKVTQYVVPFVTNTRTKETKAVVVGQVQDYVISRDSSCYNKGNLRIGNCLGMRCKQLVWEERGAHLIICITNFFWPSRETILLCTNFTSLFLLFNFFNKTSDTNLSLFNLCWFRILSWQDFYKRGSQTTRTSITTYSKQGDRNFQNNYNVF